MYGLQKIKGKNFKNRKNHHNSKILNSVGESFRKCGILLKFHWRFTEVHFLHASVIEVTADKTRDTQENKMLPLKACKAKL